MNNNKYTQLVESFSSLLRNKGFSIVGCENDEVELLEKNTENYRSFTKYILGVLVAMQGTLKKALGCFILK